LPLAELIVFVLVASAIGLGNAILIEIGLTVLGIIAMRVLAAAPLRDLMAATQMNEPPAGPMLRSACMLLGGLLLILPGFITDILGLVLIVPGLRFWIGRLIWRALRAPKLQDGVLDGQWHEVAPPGVPSGIPSGSQVIIPPPHHEEPR
jgi:UPF0716 protein FxsA